MPSLATLANFSAWQNSADSSHIASDSDKTSMRD
jgi:hypothetical protein